MRTRTLLLIPAVLLFLAPCLRAQATTATVQGYVYYGEGTDDPGAPVIAAQITADPQAAGAKDRIAITDAEGFFKITGLAPGVWTFTPFEAGFKPAEQIRATLFQGDVRRIELTLVAAERQEETVVVQAERDKLPNMIDTSTSHQIGQEELGRLSLINSTIQDVIKLMPGVSTVGGRESTDISVAGGRSSQIKYLLNGSNFTDILGGGPAGNVSSMAIEKFELISGGFQPEYGQAATGVANIITKTGTNEVEFDYAFFWRDVETIGAEIDELDQIQRTWHDLLNANSFPGAQGLLAQGLPGGLPSSLDDDNNPSPRFRMQHQIGVGGPIVVDKVFFYTNLDVLTSDFGSPFNDNEFQRDVITYLAKVTWDVAEAHKFWAELNLEQQDENGLTNPQFDAVAATEDTTGNWTFSLHDRYSFAGDGFWKDSFLESSLSVNHQYITQRPPTPDADRQVNVLLPPAGLLSLVREGPSSEIDYTINDYRATAAVTKPFGRDHNVKVGGEIGFQTIEGTARRFPVFNDFRLAFAGQFGSGNTLIGSLGQWIDPGPAQHLSEDASLAAFYAQDLWTVTDNLNLEAGVRVDYQDFVGKVLVAPRVGVSLDPVGDQQTQFRASYGHFYDNLFLNAIIHDLRPDQTVSEIIAGPEASPSTVGFNVIEIDDLVAATRRFDQGIDTLGRIFPIVTQQFDIDERLTAPLNQQWTAQIRRNLPQNIVVDLSYTEAERDNAPTFTTDTIDIGPGLEPQLQRVLFSTTGREEFQQWTLAVTKNFADGWQLNASYSQQKILGQILAAADPLDPTQIISTFGPLNRDRREVIQISSAIELPWKVQMSINFNYQSGLPITPQAFSFGLSNLGTPQDPIIVTRTNRVRPLGFNSVRLPPERNLDLSFQRDFKFGTDNNLSTRLSIFNITNELNVLSAIGTLGRLTDPNPFDSPPFEPGQIPLTVDIPRTVQLEFRLSF